MAPRPTSFSSGREDRYRRGYDVSSSRNVRRNGRETRSKEKKGLLRRGGLLRREEGGRVQAMGWFLLGPIKKPVSSSVSKSLLWHSRQLRKHLKAPEKPDNTSLLECRVPLEGRRDFAPCQRDTLRPPCVAISPLSYVLNIECPSRANSESSREILLSRFATSFANEPRRHLRVQSRRFAARLSRQN